MPPKTVGIGLLGLGVVGTGVARVLAEKSSRIADLVGCPVLLRGALVRDTGKQRGYSLPSGTLTDRAEDILDNPHVDIVVELMGGRDAALDCIVRSISLGKHVVTANKEVMARNGPEILTLARDKGVQVMFEASVGGGTPVIAPLVRDLVANEVLNIHGIINGTTNYILTRMAEDGAGFEETLREAQELGFAEADPANDIDGTDAAFKLAILATLAFRTRIKESDVYREGISGLSPNDFKYARELGYEVKLLAVASKSEGAVQMRVHPAFVPQGFMLAKVDGVLNAIEVETDLAGRVLFHGRGAGSFPTTSAVVADIVDVARNLAGNVVPPAPFAVVDDLRISPISELVTRYYLRLIVPDRAGVLAKIARVLGDLGISIASVIQKETYERDQLAELVLMTHESSEAAVRRATERIRALDVVREISSVVRVEEW